MPDSNQLNSSVACGLRPLRSRKWRSTVVIKARSFMLIVKHDAGSARVQMEKGRSYARQRFGRRQSSGAFGFGDCSRFVEKRQRTGAVQNAADTHGAPLAQAAASMSEDLVAR